VSAQPRWTLLYDADCGFCKWIVATLLAWDRDERIMPHAIQGERGQSLLGDLTRDEQVAAVHLITPRGERLSGGAVAGPLLRVLPAGAILAPVAERLPTLTATVYVWVAGHRSQLSRAVPAAVKRRASERVQRAEAERARGLAREPRGR
jgi:predicted DCC family thiol-disulfide oxidoreductase YuxK